MTTRKCRLCCVLEVNLRKCSKCKSVWYSREHQVEDWGRHKIECNDISQKKNIEKCLKLKGLRSENFDLWKTR